MNFKVFLGKCMSTSKSIKSCLFSFWDIKYNGIDEDSNLSDEIVSENVIINKPTSIAKLSKNIENFHHTIVLK